MRTFYKTLNLKTKCLFLLLLVAAYGCNDGENDILSLSQIEDTEWSPNPEGLFGYVGWIDKGIISEGMYIHFGENDVNVVQRITYLTSKEIAGTYKVEGKLLSINCEDGSSATYSMRGSGIMKLEEYSANEVSFPKTLYLCRKGMEYESYAANVLSGQTWKLDFIAREGTYKMYDYWHSDVLAQRYSMSILKETYTYTLNFEVQEKGPIMHGTFKGRGANSEISGVWEADLEQFTFTIEQFNQTEEETDILAKEFVKGLSRCLRYQCNGQTLTIDFYDGVWMRMVFTKG